MRLKKQHFAKRVQKREFTFGIIMKITFKI
jgi:hypothetical protein